ncbi:hypothetical protein [Hymenobacter crusticola]|nr:hypothetical protein [Hymenobacter crusticola]
MPTNPSDPSANLRSTNDILSGNLYAAALEAPIVIDSWIDALRTFGVTGGNDMVEELQNLKNYLNDKDTDRISASLQRLGESTTKAADQAGEEYQEQLQRLGQVLLRAADEVKVPLNSPE